MKRKILMNLILILFTMALMFIMSNTVFATDLSSIEITVPHPTIGKTLANASEITVKADGSENLKVTRIEWFRQNPVSNEYERVTDLNDIVGPSEKYEVLVNFNRPQKYGVTSSTKITLNGNTRNKDNIEEYNPHGGDLENEWTAVCYKFDATKTIEDTSKPNDTTTEDKKTENNTQQTTKPSTTTKPTKPTDTKIETDKKENNEKETVKDETLKTEDTNNQIIEDNQLEETNKVENSTVNTQLTEKEDMNSKSSNSIVVYIIIGIIFTAIVGLGIAFVATRKKVK